MPLPAVVAIVTVSLYGLVALADLAAVAMPWPALIPVVLAPWVLIGCLAWYVLGHVIGLMAAHRRRIELEIDLLRRG
jgi:hypothetical protein